MEHTEFSEQQNPQEPVPTPSGAEGELIIDCDEDYGADSGYPPSHKYDNMKEAVEATAGTKANDVELIPQEVHDLLERYGKAIGVELRVTDIKIDKPWGPPDDAAPIPPEPADWPKDEGYPLWEEVAGGRVSASGRDPASDSEPLQPLDDPDALSRGRTGDDYHFGDRPFRGRAASDPLQPPDDLDALSRDRTGEVYLDHSSYKQADDPEWS